MESRADRIYEILLKNGPRMKVQDIRAKLVKSKRLMWKNWCQRLFLRR